MHISVLLNESIDEQNSLKNRNQIYIDLINSINEKKILKTNILMKKDLTEEYTINTEYFFKKALPNKNDLVGAFLLNTTKK